MYKKVDSNILNATATGSTAEVEMYVSVFNTVDSVGDRVQPHAFDGFLASLKARRGIVPICWSHDWKTAAAVIVIASYDDFTVDTYGLKVRAHLDLTNETAKTVYNNIKSGAVNSASFSYDIIREHALSDGTNSLDEIDMLECGPTLFGAHRGTRMVSASLAKLYQKSASAMVDSIRRGRVEHVVKRANLVGTPIPQAIADEAR